MTWAELWRLPTATDLLLPLLAAAAVAAAAAWWSHTRVPPRVPPGRFGPPLLGETPVWAARLPAFHAARVRAYGPTYRTHLLSVPTVVLGGGVAAHEVYLAADAADALRTRYPPGWAALLGDSALLATPESDPAYAALVAALGGGSTPTPPSDSCR